MDPADLNLVKMALSAQGKKIHLHEAQLTTICSRVKELTERHTELQSSVATQVNHLAAQLHLVITCLEDLAPPKPATPASNQSATPPALPSVSLRPVRLSPAGEVFLRF
ncbi:hypothetical protein L3Q82_019359 [Scortum barcoo]|uniref:Uncharacterized protein n=1 Tax=Scortum barcoo TaxID=214431 RepID=A0ACB8VB86_9TELE|nr:hypothetical protein L3Q82_019359 [Scortum barcoo]